MERSGDDGSYDVSGEVTFRGVSRQVKDEMTIHALDDKTVQLAGKSRFDIRGLRDGAAPHADVEGRAGGGGAGGDRRRGGGLGSMRQRPPAEMAVPSRSEQVYVSIECRG